MKKILSIFSILLAFMACNNENLVIDTPSTENESNDISVNFTITRSDDFGSTKATVKSAWADNDVIFVFFKGIAAPKYLEMKYNSSTDTWTSTVKKGLTSSDLSDAADKKMTAIYLPYGNTAKVAGREGKFIFCGLTYSGYFLKAELVSYTFDGDVLNGTLNMTAPELSSGSDKLIHFDISGFTSGHNYRLYQEYVKPLIFTSVSADGVLSIDEGTMGASITGYEDGSMMSFSGILDASAVGNAVDYQFSIDDLTSSILYIRDAGTKTLSTSKYIGIGVINNTAVWNAFEYVDLGLPSGIRWSKCNVGATIETEYGDYFAWGDTETYYEPGYAQDNPQTHWKAGNTDGYSWSAYKWCKGYHKLTKYCNDSEYGNNGFTDTKIILDPEDDVAHVMWGGSWRMPTMSDWSNLLPPLCTWTWYDSDNTEFNGVAGYKVTSKVPGYTDRSIFLPAAGYCGGMGSYGVGSYGKYYSSSLLGDDPNLAYTVKFNYYAVGRDPEGYRNFGQSVRPVCTVDPDLPKAPSYEYVDLGLSVKWATFNVGASKPEEYGDYYAWGETEPYYESGFAQENPQFEWKDGKTAGYSIASYKWCNGSSNTLTKYCTMSSQGDEGFIDGKTVLDMEDDVAHVKWGGSWRMPTKAEQEELIENCTWTWTTMNDIKGYLVTSNKTGYTDQSIFIPASGFRTNISLRDVGSYCVYWSSSLNSEDPSNAWRQNVFFIYPVDRYFGYTIRPVCP